MNKNSCPGELCRVSVRGCSEDLLLDFAWVLRWFWTRFKEAGFALDWVFSCGCNSDWESVLVCWGCHNKTPQTGWLKQQTFIFSQFWRPEVQDQGVSRSGFSWGLSPWLVEGRFLAVSSHGGPTMPECPWCLFCVQISSSYKDSSQIGLVPTLTAPF